MRPVNNELEECDMEALGTDDVLAEDKIKTDLVNMLPEFMFCLLTVLYFV